VKEGVSGVINRRREQDKSNDTLVFAHNMVKCGRLGGPFPCSPYHKWALLAFPSLARREASQAV